MLEENYLEESAAKQLSVCKRDYEREIKHQRERLEKTSKFRDAALEYFEGRVAQKGMAELIGELVTKARVEQFAIDVLIEAQENSK